ncbi:MAG: hypothetical protein AB4372_10610 [Xenococcus sp. (in: cyanobacteria)]
MPFDIHFNKSNTCPICEQGRGCKQDSITHVIVCRGNPIEHPEFTETGANGQWRYFLPNEYVVNHKELTPEEKAAWARERKEEEQRRKAYEAAKRNKLIPQETRHRLISSLISQLTLLRKHRQNLLDRGLTNADISEGSFVSIKKYQRVVGVDGLPGFDKGKYVGATGYLCPARNAMGQYTGFQVRADNADQGKYKWTSHWDDQILVQAKLREYIEYPMNVAQNGEMIGICEGLLKPFVGAKRYNITLIGYSGGQRSFNYLKEQLAKLNPLAAKPIIIFPDAGILSNTGDVFNINLDYAKAIQLLGYQVKIADWGHWIDKKKGDIDEIPNLENVEYHDLDYLVHCKKENSLYLENNDLDTRWLKFELPAFAEKLAQRIKVALPVSRRKIELVNQEFNWGDYIPGNLPHPGTNNQPIEFDTIATRIYEEVARKNYKYVLDTSQTGAGKTYGASLVEPSRCALFQSEDEKNKTKLFYLTQQSRNPNVLRLETDFTELPARTIGYALDSSKTTPTGKPYRVRAKSDHEIRTNSNCHWAAKFQVVRGNRSEADICSSCPFSRRCRGSEGDGYGFKYQIQQALKAEKIIANPQGLAEDMVSNKSVLIIDEYNQSVAWEEAIAVRPENIQETINQIVASSSSETYRLLPILGALKKLIEKEDITSYGISTIDILGQLPTVDFAELEPGLNALLKINESFNQKVIEQEKGAEPEDLDQLLIKNWVEPLILLLSGQNKYGSLSLHNNKLTITIRNRRLLQVFRKSKTVIFQDATGSRLDLALKLGVDVNDILVIRRKGDIPQNVTIHQVVGCGKLGSFRRESAKEKVALLRKIISDRHEKVGFIDYKAFALEGDMVHFVDARGSNRFQDRDAIAAFGAPCPNLGALLAQYETYTGERVTLSDSNMQLYINDKVSAENIQEIGRLRANRRLDEELHYYLCSDIDTTFLKQLGFNVEVTNAVNLDIDLGSKQQKARYGLLAAFRSIQEEGLDILKTSQTDIANKLGCSQGNISLLAKTLGGWQQLKRAMVALLCGKSSQSKYQLTDDDIFIANSYLPDLFKCNWQEIADDLGILVSDYREGQLESILQAVPLEAAATFLSKMICYFPQERKRDILALYSEFIE